MPLFTFFTFAKYLALICFDHVSFVDVLQSCCGTVEGWSCGLLVAVPCRVSYMWRNPHRLSGLSLPKLQQLLMADLEWPSRHVQNIFLQTAAQGEQSER